jgi:hypothetical protein
MRNFLWFLGAIATTLLVAALLAYPLYLLVHPLMPAWRFDRIGGRLWEFGLLPLGLVLVVRRLRLLRREDWGYGAPRPRWLRQFRIGLVAGLASMLPVTATMLVTGARTLLPDPSPGQLAASLAAGLGSGLAVAFIEETFFRGLVQGAVLREARSKGAALLAVALLFSALHFLGHARIEAEAIDWHSGFTLLGMVLGNFTAPGAVADAFLALAAVGLLLGVVTAWTGNIALAVGLHAGWVWMMRTTVGLTRADPGAPLGWLVSRTDGYTGWLVFAWTLVMLLALLALRDRVRRLGRGY